MGTTNDMEIKLNIDEEKSVMDFSKKIDGVRFNLSQNKHNQVTIKKEKEIILVQNMNHKLELKEMQKMIMNASLGKYSIPVPEPVVVEEKQEEPIVEKVEEMPTPHPCLFCGGIPKIVNLRDAEGNNGNFRALQCTGNNCISSRSGTRVSYKYWIYTVDIIDNDVDAADRKLILEWNKRMPLVNRGK